MASAATATHARIVTLLDDAGASYVLHEHVAVTTVTEARALVPELADNLLKTIAFEVAGTPRRVLAAVAADSDIDYKALAAALGCNRRALRLLPAARVEAELGFEVGGVGPFPVQEAIEVVVDAALDPRRIVRCGAGLRTRTLEIALGGLIQAVQPCLAPVGRLPSDAA